MGAKLQAKLTCVEIGRYRASLAWTLRMHRDLPFREIARVLKLRGPGEARMLVARNESLIRRLSK